jgi:hypothetical protein
VLWRSGLCGSNPALLVFKKPLRNADQISASIHALNGGDIDVPSHPRYRACAAIYLQPSGFAASYCASRLDLKNTGYAIDTTTAMVPADQS